MILSRDLYVTYKWRQDTVLKGVTGSFNRKSLILGPNGSGKTTLFRAICALTNIQSGEILIDDKAIEDIYATEGILSTNFQEVFTLIGVNVYETIKLYTDLCDGDSEFALRTVEDFGIETEFLKKRKHNELSSGQTKIVCTALALAMGAKNPILLLSSLFCL